MLQLKYIPSIPSFAHNQNKANGEEYLSLEEAIENFDTNAAVIDILAIKDGE